ncbi:MAG: hypothetical protein JKX70_06210 [Phycisphaerales bacterium]|nr:hypothetical protein [Phycisphaerales bacterium]
MPIKAHMISLTTGMLIVLGFTSAITALAVLSAFANVIGHETQIHDLRNRVKELHFQHALYLARMNSQIAEAGVEIVEAPSTPTAPSLEDPSDALPISQDQPLPEAQSLPESQDAQPVQAA